MDKILNFIESPSILITIVSLLIIAFAKTIISIFRMGVTFKSNLATKKELKDFETEIRKDIRMSVASMQKTVTDACMRIIDSKLADVEEIQQAAVDIKVLKAELEAEIKHIMEEYNEIKSIGDTVRKLSNTVSRMQYKTDTANNDRRTEK